MDKEKKRKTKKKLLIVESTSSKSSNNLPKTKTLKNKKSKKNILIIESSSPEIQSLEKKEKNEIYLPENKVVKDLNPMTDVKEESMIRLNEKFIEIMEKLSEIMSKNGESFRARAYQKAQETIMSYPYNISSPEQLNGKPGIGPTIMEKLNEYVNTGTLKILEREKNNPVNIFTQIYGVGPKKAKELVEKGVTTIQQLKENQIELLNDKQMPGAG